MYKHKKKSRWDGGYFKFNEKKSSASIEKVETRTLRRLGYRRYRRQQYQTSVVDV